MLMILLGQDMGGRVLSCSEVVEECFLLCVMPYEMCLAINIACASDGCITILKQKYIRTLMEKFVAP